MKLTPTANSLILVKSCRSVSRDRRPEGGILLDTLEKRSLFDGVLRRAGSPVRIFRSCKDGGWIGCLVVVCLATFVMSSVFLKVNHSIFGHFHWPVGGIS